MNIMVTTSDMALKFMGRGEHFAYPFPAEIIRYRGSLAAHRDRKCSRAEAAGESAVAHFQCKIGMCAPGKST